MKDNLLILWQDFPKLSVALALTVIILLGLCINWVVHIPSMVSCMWEAGYTQKISSENYEYRIFSDTCVVKRGDRWLPISKGVDAAGMSDE